MTIVNAPELPPLLARAVAERDMYKQLHQSLLATLRAKSERCGYCGRPLTEPGHCGIPGAHVDGRDPTQAPAA